MRDPFPGLNVCWSTLVLGTGHLIFKIKIKIKERSLLLSLPSKNLKGNFVYSVTFLWTQHEEIEKPVKYAAIHKRRGSVT